MFLTNFNFVLILLIPNIYANKPVIVHSQYGDILGYETNMSRIFYGIPFAQPPIDSLRWQPPVPVTKWDPKVLNATRPQPACSQPADTMKFTITTPPVMSEDCLYLNIFTPLSSNVSSTHLLPVMLFIHGGDFQFGSASASIYESERLVNTTNIIIALIQYRLGVLGFLATGNGPYDIKGNYGILDQRLAITWVKDNINAFGGDPNQITLFGQSAGAQSTALHYVTNEMQPFFQRAIIQSAPMTVPFRTYLDNVTPTVLLAEQLHCSPNNLTCFRSRSVDEIIIAQAEVNKKVTSLNPLSYFEPWLPVIDNYIVHGQLINTIRNVSFPLKPLIIGTVTEECFDFVYSTWKKAITATEYAGFAIGLFGEKALKVLEHYPPSSSGDQRALLVRLATHWVFACSTRVFARKAASYSYVFGYPYDKENLLSCPDHACHANDLPFTFESFWQRFTSTGRYISQGMATYWTNFAKSQNPNDPSSVPLSWPTATSGNETYMFIQNPFQIGEYYLKSDCDLWDQIELPNAEILISMTQQIVNDTADDENIHEENGIDGYKNLPLVSFEMAISPLYKHVRNLDKAVDEAKKYGRRTSHGLNDDETKAIYLYTMEIEPTDAKAITTSCPHCSTSLTLASTHQNGQEITCCMCKKKFIEITCIHCSKLNVWKNADRKDGEITTCWSCKKQFHHLNCPHCTEPNIWKDANYIQGQKISCWSCKKLFQHLNCPNCLKENFWKQADYNEGQKIPCWSCKKQFQHVSCPHCSKENFWKNADRKEGSRTPCWNCKKQFQHINCPHCSQPNVWKDANRTEGGETPCYYCGKQFQIVTCPHCSEANFWKKSDYIQGTTVPCWSCKKQFQHINCPHCKKGNFWKNADYKQRGVTTCYSCQSRFQHVICPYCNSENIFQNADLSSNTQVECHGCSRTF
ncbi:hypothetical protein I4U23_015845 [Adineta vaga]|nr:hypothetical protein I4U23_015845 [Adineta vaga]